jgi:FkbM family methyltransferase
MITSASPMLHLKRFLAENHPSAKPELWNAPGKVLRRRLSGWLNTQLDPRWPTRPYITSIEPEGLLLEVVPSDVIGKPIAFFGSYEYAVSALVRSYLDRGDVFVDVGANLGYFTVLGAAAVGPSGLVLAYEPHAAIRARLERNVSLNALTQVRVRGEAVSDVDGTLRLLDVNEAHNAGLSRLARPTEGGGVPVKTIRLDSVPELRRAPPRLIKIDVEGHELEVFGGAAGLLAHDDAPALLFEAFDVERYAAVLASHGYAVYQPRWSARSVRLTSDLGAAPYRSWEAPNFFAVKSRAGRRFAAELAQG